MDSDRRADNIYKINTSASVAAQIASAAVQNAEGKLKVSSRSDTASSVQTPLKIDLIYTHHSITTSIQTKCSEGSW